MKESYVFRIIAACIACAISACSSLPQHPERIPSNAILDTAQTGLGRAAEAELAVHPGLSAFHPMGQGPDAFVARVALARAAERTLDVQYYDFHADSTGITLLGELLAAGDRGVRVRLLLDDLHSGGRDEVLAVIDSHPDIEVRLFNPFAHRNARWLDLVGDFSRVDRRMHNKSMTADNQASIVGGRNIGDEYFAAKTDVEFGDFDVLTFGPVVSEVSEEFDQYWNSSVVYPVASLAGGGSVTEAALPALREKVAEHVQTLRGTAYKQVLEQSDLARSIAEKRLTLYWGTGTVIADRPEKVTLPLDDPTTHAILDLQKLLVSAKTELMLVTPYFVPGTWGLKWFQDLAARGIRVKVLTNSYAATDVAAVHAGYSAYREALLRAGIELYELKPSAGDDLAREGKRKLTGMSRSALHAKTYMVDHDRLFVGSLNLDPRSVLLNTEMGIVIGSADLCAYVHDHLVSQLPEIAYRVELDTDGRLVWITQEDGREVRYTDEPGIGAFAALTQWLLRLLPIEQEL